MPDRMPWETLGNPLRQEEARLEEQQRRVEAVLEFLRGDQTHGHLVSYQVDGGAWQTAPLMAS